MPGGRKVLNAAAAAIAVAAMACPGVAPSAPGASTFFDRTAPATVSFDGDAKVWTFGNARIRGKVAYDDKTQGFKMISLADLKNGLDVAAAPSSAGSFTILGPSVWTRVEAQSPKLPVNGQPYSAELTAFPVKTKARFLRLVCTMPHWEDPGWPDAPRLAQVQVMAAGRDVAPGKTVTSSGSTKPSVLADTGSYGDTTDPGYLMTSHPVPCAWWQIDLGGARDVEELRIRFAQGDKAAAGKYAGVPGKIAIFATTGETPDALPVRVLDLAADFRLGGWSVNENPAIKGGGVKTLRIEAVGVGPNAGITAGLCYDLYPGDEPWVTKWFTLSAPQLAGDASMVLGRVTFDEFATGDRLDQARNTSFLGRPKGAVSSLNMAPARDKAGQGFMASNLNYQSDMQVAAGKVGVAYRPNFGMGEYLAVTGGRTTKAFEGFWDGGSLEAGEFQYQVFLVDRHIAAGPSTTQPVVALWPAGTYDIINPEAARVYSDMGFAGIMTVPVNNWARLAFRTGKAPAVYDPADPKGFPRTMADAGLGPCLYYAFLSYGYTDGRLTDPAQARAFGRFLGALTARTNTILWFIEDPTPAPSPHYVGAVGRGDVGPTDAMWREDVRVMYDEIRAAVAPRKVSLGRTWIKQLELFDIADWSLEADYDNYGWADGWIGFAMSQIPLRPNSTLACCSPVTVVSRDKVWTTPFLPREGKDRKTPEDLEFTTSRSANFGIMMQWLGTGNILQAMPEEIAVQKRWTTWHNASAPWLEYTQTLEAEGGLPPKVTGLMHLRNELDGKYGFLGWWNTQAPAVTVAPRIDPAKWMLKLDPAALVIRSVRTGKEVPFTVRDGVIRLEPQETPGWSFEVLELARKGH